MATIRFLGGTSTVTGSKFLVDHEGSRVLIDCGMFQGNRRTRQRNWNGPFESLDLPDQVVLTHAHIDHTGYLPRLIGAHGYQGPVVATPATADLLHVMLPDSARIQQEQAAYANKKGYSRHRPALPLYTEQDAAAALSLLRPRPYHEWFSSGAGRARFTFAGHILGSAHVTMEIGSARVVFSGDIGRWDVPVIKDPEPPPPADLVVMESTYGARDHAAAEPDPSGALAAAVDEIVAGEGVMVVPAFALGRTQEVLYRLRALEDEGRIPSLPVFLDSPMAIDATELYRRHREEHDLEMAALDRAAAGPLQPDRLRFTRTPDESKSLNSLRGPAVIISASGMATAGRVLHHLKRLLPSPRNMVVFVGYQAAGTRGRALLDGATRVTIHGKRIPVRAAIRRISSFSAHADRGELVRWLRGAAGLPKRVALVHGEHDARRALAEHLRSELGVDVILPRQGSSLQL